MVPNTISFGLDKSRPHTHQYYADHVPEPDKIEAGVKILAEEIERARREG